MHFFSAATLTALAVSATGVMAAPSQADNVKSLDELHEIFDKALTQVEEAQVAKRENSDVEKRQPGGITCSVLGDGACWASVCIVSVSKVRKMLT